MEKIISWGDERGCGSYCLDEFCAATGYHRKYAIRLLKHGAKLRGLKKSGRTKLYQGAVVAALTRIWEICGRICSRRLHPFLPEITRVLEQHKELSLPAEVKQLLLQMSRSSIDRCLRPARFEHLRGLSTTKPGSLLREAIRELRTRLPFALLGIDSDNGSEFINDLLYRYCLDEQITSSRCRTVTFSLLCCANSGQYVQTRFSSSSQPRATGQPLFRPDSRCSRLHTARSGG